MPVTVGHVLSATTPDDPGYEIRPSHWNSNHAVTLNISGTDISGAFANDGNVTFGTNVGGFVTATANVTAAPSPINITGANGSSVNAQTLAFSNANGMTLGVSTAANGATVTGSYTVPTQSVQPVAFSAVGGSSNFSTLSFSNANGISFSNNAGQVQASYTVPTVTNSSMTVSDAASSGTVARLAFTNLNGVTLSLSTGAAGSHTIVGSHNGLTSQSNQAASASNGSFTFQTLGFSNANNVTFGTSAGSIISASVLAQTNQSLGIYGSSQTVGQSSSSTYDARSLTMVGQGNISVGWSNGSLLMSGTQSVQTQASGNIVGSGVTTAGNNIGLSGTLNSAGLSLSATVAAQTNQTLGIYASSNTTGQSSSSTYDARSLSMVGSDNISIGWSNGSLVFKGAAGGGVTPVASASNGSFSFTTLAFSNANNVTFGTSAGNIITASVAAPGAAAENNWVNLLGANTAGNTTASGSTIGFSGINMTLSGTNNSQIVMSVPGTSSLVGVNGISISSNGSTISISNQQFTGSWWQPEVYGNTVPLTQANGTVYLRPFEVDGYFDVDKINMFQSFNSSRSTGSFSASVSNASSSSGSGSWGLSGTYLIFSRVQTQKSGASYNSIVSAYSNTYTVSAGYSASCSWNANVSSATNSVTTAYSVGFPQSIGSDGAVTYGNTGTTGTTSFSSTSTNANSFSSSFALAQVYSHLSGIRAVFIPAGTSLGTGAIAPGEYWFGLIQSTTWGSTNMPSLGSCASMSDAGRLFFTASTNNYMEIGNSVAFTTSGIRPQYGSANVSSATTTHINLATFSSISSYASMWFVLDGRSK
jgi:hypothetical protein